MPTQKEFDLLWLQIADAVANMSKDPSTKVGCVIVKDNRYVSLGYNGFPPGVEESVERWARPEKYEWVIHAEENAMLQARFDVRNAICYCTIAPCHRCMGRLIAAGISRIIYRKPYANTPRPDIVNHLARHFTEVSLLTS